MRKEKRKNKRKAKLWKGLFLFLLVIGTLLGICLYAPVFNVSEIAISGNDSIEAEQIKNSSGVIMNTNIFKVSKKKVKKSLMSIPQIDDINIKRKLPHRIVIEITETYPQLIIPYQSGYLITNEKFKIIEIADDASSYDLTEINGIDVNNAKICEKISVQDEVTFGIITDCIAELKRNDVLGIFSQLDFSNISNFYGYTKDGVKIIFGKISDLEYKLSVLNNVLSQVGRTEGTYIDLTTPSSAFVGREETPAATPTVAPAEKEGSQPPQEADASASTQASDSKTEKAEKEKTEKTEKEKND